MDTINKSLATCFIGLLLACYSLSGGAAYTEPTRRIALNEALALSSEPTTYPLYLRYGGRYYAELYLQNADGDVDRTHTKPISIEVQIDIARKGRLLKSETKQVTFAPGQASQTLFWTRAPFDLPQRKNLDMTVTLVGIDDASTADIQTLRLQVTRKFEFTPIYR